MNPVFFSSTEHGFHTPPEVLEPLKEFGIIELDPCTVASNPTGALRFFTPEDDGLEQNWELEGDKEHFVFMNSPYGRAIKLWVEKANRMHQNNGINIVALVPARTDTQWWHKASFDRVCFWEGRLRFIHPETGERMGSAPFPSALLYWGWLGPEFEDVFEAHGMVL